MIETKMMAVTPAVARAWLEHNTINRPLRRSTVNGLVHALSRGEYRTTHQGIAFGATGELLDGQHRLTAISEMPDGFAVNMLVTTGMDVEAFKAIDIGVRRTPADVLKLSPGLVGAARYMALMVESAASNVTPQYILPFALGIEDAYGRLIGFCPKSVKAWSSAAVRAAAVLQLLDGKDADYVCVTYHALVHAEFDSMPRVAQSFYRQHVKGLVSTRTYDMFCRAFKAFDPEFASVEKLQITDTAGTLIQAREIIRARIIGNAQKKAAPVMSAAKKVNVANSKARA